MDLRFRDSSPILIRSEFSICESAVECCATSDLSDHKELASDPRHRTQSNYSAAKAFQKLPGNASSSLFRKRSSTRSSAISLILKNWSFR
ncbi:hypothetical protein Nepgr_018496 [Nepenthes gracilis]|uniref:Uncharacterized protein n=1 Tax=Nepenthes gracilis TaxID=150966 RepID=A0AAD3SRG9_NEPGR|nr:hypothetical protein Nepgr_018496 [Nepenthes gracilis]